MIYPTTLFEHVERHGGYDKVNESKLWTAGVWRPVLAHFFLSMGLVLPPSHELHRT